MHGPAFTNPCRTVAYPARAQIVLIDQFQLVGSVVVVVPICVAGTNKTGGGGGMNGGKGEKRDSNN